MVHVPVPSQAQKHESGKKQPSAEEQAEGCRGLFTLLSILMLFVGIALVAIA